MINPYESTNVSVQSSTPRRNLRYSVLWWLAISMAVVTAVPGACLLYQQEISRTAQPFQSNIEVFGQTISCSRVISYSFITSGFLAALSLMAAILGVRRWRPGGQHGK